MENNRKVILYIATSLDGYIAKPNDDLSFLSLVQKEGEDYGYANFEKTIDTVILGRKTYDWVTKAVRHFPHADKTLTSLQELNDQTLARQFFIQET